MNKETKIKEKKTNTLLDSKWSNFKYGLGMIAIIIIPPLIPDASVKILIIGYMSLINIVYIACAVSVAINKIFPAQPSKRGSHIRRYGRDAI